MGNDPVFLSAVAPRSVAVIGHQAAGLFGLGVGHHQLDWRPRVVIG